MENVTQENEKAISGAIKIDEKEIRTHLDGLVRQSVEDTLNALLNAEADAICQASRYQRSPDRQDTRAGSYKRKLLTKAGEVELHVPRLRTLPFETQIIERYKTKLGLSQTKTSSNTLKGPYLSRASMQCPSSNNQYPASSPLFNWWRCTYAMEYTSPGNLPEELGDYIISAWGPERYLLVLGRMKRPTETLVFADSITLTANAYSYPRFKANDVISDGGDCAINMIHSGRTVVAFADGHAASHSGEELNRSTYNLRCWIRDGKLIKVSE